ncbi:MAG TPA: hypothetical protein VGG61_05580 [Gemmataceae bacterium]
MAGIDSPYPSNQRNNNLPRLLIILACTGIVTGITGKSIYVTAVFLAPAATSAISFVSGTGATCTSPTTLTGIMTFAAGQQLDIGSGYGAIFVVPQGQTLCIVIATAAAPAFLSYAQF